MLLAQKEVANVGIICYGEKELENNHIFPTTLRGYFDALKWCTYTFNGEHNTLSFGAAAVDADFYFQLLDGLSKEKPSWTAFSATVEETYRQANGVDIQHKFTMRNFTCVTISHKNSATDGPEEIIFTFS